MNRIIRLYFVILGFVLSSANAVAQCDINDFTLTAVAGTCGSDAELVVQSNACKGTSFEAVLSKAGNQFAPISLDTNGKATFPSLSPGDYEVLLRDKTNARESSVKRITLTTSYKPLKYRDTYVLKEASCTTGVDGTVRVRLYNTGGVGPYQVVLRKGTDVITSPRIAKSGTSGETYIDIPNVPVGTHSVEVIDLVNDKIGCRYSENYSINVTGRDYKPQTNSHFKPRCEDCGTFDALHMLYFQDVVNQFRPGTFRVKITRGTTVVATDVYHTSDRVNVAAEGITQGYRSWTFDDSRYYSFKSKTPLRPSDKLEYEFTPDDATAYCGLKSTGSLNVPRATNSLNYYTLEEKQTDSNCGTTQTSRYYVAFDQYSNPSIFCEKNITLRVLKQNGADWDLVSSKNFTAQDYLSMFGVHRDAEFSRGRGRYRVELYPTSNTNGTDKSTCKYWFRDVEIGDTAVVKPSYLDDITIGDYTWSLLEGTPHGFTLNVPNNNRTTYSDTNPLQMSIMPVDGRTQDRISKVGQLSIAQDYTITYPVNVEIKQNGSYNFYDLPLGRYRFTFTANGCNSRVIEYEVKGNLLQYNLVINTLPGCSNGEDIHYSFNQKRGTSTVTDPFDYVRLWKDTNPTSLGNISFDDAISRKGTQQSSQGYRVNQQTGDRVFAIKDVPPGRYLIEFYRPYWLGYSLLDNPSNGYTNAPNGYTKGKVNKEYMANSSVFYAIEIKESKKVSLSPIAVLCDPNNPNTGVIGVEAQGGLKYPLTYTLYKQNKTTGSFTRALNNAGAEIPVHTIATEPVSGDTYHTFTRVPRLTYADEIYVVRLTTPCFEEDFQIPDFVVGEQPEVRFSGSRCPGTDITLDVGLPSNMYRFTWHSSENTIPAGLINQKRITFKPSRTATYWVEYTAIDPAACGSNARFTSKRKEIQIIEDTVAPVITQIANIEQTALGNSCTRPVSWTVPTVTDAQGCFASLTWRVLDANNNPIYVPALDTEGINSVGSSWDNFPVGQSVVEYTAKDTAGNTSTMTFNVVVRPQALSVDVQNQYTDNVGTALPIASIGGTAYYQVSVHNTGSTTLNGVVIEVTLPKSANFALPTADKVLINELVSGGNRPNVVYDNTTGVYTITSIPSSLFASNAPVRKIYFPIEIKGKCSDYVNACASRITSKVKVTFSGGNVNCPVQNQVVNQNASIEVDGGTNCDRQELFCGTSQNLVSIGTGYDSYQWYLNGIEIAGAVSQNYTATEAGVYEVLREATCSGTTIQNVERIHLLEQNALVTSDPIKAQADGGAECLDTNQWVSHFFLCDGVSKNISVTFASATKLSWQRYDTNCNTSSTKANCQNKEDRCWTEVGTGNVFTLSQQANYRLRVIGATCTQDFYFSVYTLGLGGTLTARNQDDTGLGSITVSMDTSGKPYKYVLKDKETGEEIQPEVNSTNNEHTFTGIQIPKGTKKTFIVEVTSTAIKGCVFRKEISVEDKTTMKVTSEFLNWIDCADGNFKFTVEGGVAPFRVAIYSIDGELQHPTYATLEQIPDSEFLPTGGSTQRVFNQKFTITSPEGNYVFVVRDSGGQNISVGPVKVIPNPNYQIESFTEEGKCGVGTSTITVRFLRSLSIPQKVKLYKNTIAPANFVTENNSGIFTGQRPGTYYAVIETLSGKTCSFQRKVIVTQTIQPLVAFLGIEKDIACEPTKGYKVNINNVSGGKPPYTYSFTGGNDGTFFASNTGYISNTGSVYVRDDNGCVLELPVTVDPALLDPTVAADLNQLLTYDCEGNGRLTINPMAPAGKTYSYTYKLDGVDASNTFVLPPKAGGGSYRIDIFYTDASPGAILNNLLISDNFGTGGDGETPYVPLTYRGEEPLIDGTYVLTENLRPSAEYGFPMVGTPSGRYLAAAPTTSSKVIYERVIRNIVPQKRVFVSLKYINLLLGSAIGKANPSVKVELQVGGTTYTKNLPAPVRDADWASSGNLEFEELAQPGQTFTQATLRIIVEGTTNSAVGIDDINVYQDTESCRLSMTRVVTPQRGKQFNPNVVNTEDPKCKGQNGKIYVEVTNNGGATQLSYSLNAGADWLDANLETGSTTRYVIEAPAGSYTLKFKKDDCVITATSVVKIQEPQDITVTNISATNIGCEGAFLTSTVTLNLQGGTKPYTAIRYREKGTGAWQTANAVVVNNSATISGLQEGKTYEFALTDKNSCNPDAVIAEKTIPNKVIVEFNVENTLCYKEGQGVIGINVTAGVAPYEFSIDGVRFENNPDDINASTMEYTGLNSGIYTVVVKDALGCKTTKTITIYPELTLELNSNDAFDCSTTPSEKITLEANGGKGTHTFVWRRGSTGAYKPSTDNDSGNVVFGTPTVVGNRTTIEVTVKTVGHYYFQVLDENTDNSGVACTETKDIDIRIIKPEWKNGLVLGATEILCEGASTSMIGVNTGTAIRAINLATDIEAKGLYPYEILVYKKVGGVIDDSQNMGTRNLPAGTYVVRLKDAKGCISDDKEVVVTQKPKPNLSVTKISDISCSAGGIVNYGRIQATWNTGGTPPFTVSLYNSRGNLATRVSNNVAHQYPNRLQVETLSFDDLQAGDYEVVMVDFNGCRTTAKITIAGLSNAIVVEPQVATCTSTSAKVITYATTGTIDATKVKFAIYEGGNPATYASSKWTNATQGTYVVGGTTVTTAEATIQSLQPGVTYRFVVNDNGCYSISDEVKMNTGTTTKVDAIKGLTACAGNDGKISFTLKDIPAGVTGMTYTIYNYPANTTVSTHTITATSSVFSHTEVSNSLVPGEYYVVFTETATGCMIASEPFTIVKPDVNMLAGLQLTKNETCTESAHIVANVTGGRAGYKYIFKADNVAPTEVEWAAVTAEPNLQKEFKTEVRTALTASGNWYVFIQDDYGCVVSASTQIEKDKTPTIESVKPENLCAANGNYHLKVVMSQLGPGQHYYTITRNGVTTGRRPITFTLNGAGKYEFVATNIYSDDNSQTITIYDFNKCPSDAVTFDVNKRVTFDAKVTTKLSCLTTPNAQITISNFSRVIAYKYKVMLVTTSLVTDPLTGEEIIQETETEVKTLATGSNNEVFSVAESGKYRVYVYDDAAADCPITTDVIVNPRELPITTQVGTPVDELCPNTLTVGAGTGEFTVSAGGLSIAGFKFAITRAIDLTTNSALTGIPTAYTTPTEVSIPGVVEIDATKTIATFKGLKGTPQGVRYYIVATSLVNNCESIPLQVTVRAPFPIEVTNGSVSVNQFACDATQSLEDAKISIDASGVSGGTAPYNYVFKKGTQVLQNSRNSEYIVFDKTGGAYTIEVVDNNGCVFVLPTTYTINPYVSIETISTEKIQQATCIAGQGESVKVKITTDPATLPAGGFMYRIESESVQQQENVVMGTEHIFTNLEVGVYKVTVRNNDTNCEIYSSYEVEDPNTFVVTATDPKRVTCYGGNDGEITLTFVDTDHNNGDQAATGFTYVITNIATGAVIQASVASNTTTVTGLVAGMYRVEATSTTGCKTRFASQFSIRQAFESITGSATAEYQPTCSNDQGEIFVDIQGGIAPYKVELIKDSGEIKVVTDVYDRYLFTGLSGPANPGDAIYTIKVTDDWGCEITLTDKPRLTLEERVSYTTSFENPTCKEGENGTITVSNIVGGAEPFFVELQHKTDGSIYYLMRASRSDSPIFTGLKEGVYVLNITDRWGCTPSAQEITLTDPSKIEFKEIDRSEAICYEGTTGFITVQVSGGTPGTAGYTLQLVDTAKDVIRAEKIGVQPSTDVTFDNLSPHINYEIRVMDSKNCLSKEVHSFTLEHLPDLTAKLEYVEACVNNAYEGKIVATFDAGTMDWTKVRYAINSNNIADAKPFDDFRLNAAYVDVDATVPVGEQTMTIFYVRPSSVPGKAPVVCSKESKKYTVRDHTSLKLERDLRDDLAVNEVRVQGKFGVGPYRYYFNDQYYSDTNTYLVKRTDKDAVEPTTGRTMKVISARVEDNLGCSQELLIYYEFIDVEIPRYFTPTGDGINDGWSPKYTTHYPNLSVDIFDRYGRLIKVLRQGEQWDGKYNGKELPAGDYWYIFKLNDENDPREFKGHFTLYR